MKDKLLPSSSSGLVEVEGVAIESWRELQRRAPLLCCATMDKPLGGPHFP